MFQKYTIPSNKRCIDDIKRRFIRTEIRIGRLKVTGYLTSSWVPYTRIQSSPERRKRGRENLWPMGRSDKRTSVHRVDYHWCWDLCRNFGSIGYFGFKSVTCWRLTSKSSLGCTIFVFLESRLGSGLYSFILPMMKFSNSKPHQKKVSLSIDYGYSNTFDL